MGHRPGRGGNRPGCGRRRYQQAINSALRVTDSPAVHEQVLRETLAVAAEMPFDQPPPAMGQLIHRRIRELTGISDPCLAAKQKANELAMGL